MITATDGNQASRNDPNHIVEKAIRGDFEPQVVPIANHGDARDLTDGMAGLTLGSAKALKIVLADQHLRCSMHARCVQGLSNPSDPSSLQTRARRAIQNRVLIRPLKRTVPRMEVVRHLGRPVHRNAVREMAVGAKGPCAQRPLYRGIKVAHLSERVYAGVGSAGAMHRDRDSCDGRESRLHSLLHRRAVRLALPAAEPAAVVLDG